MKIYVSNLDFTLEDADLKSLFEEYGEVNSAIVITDQTTGRSRGFGFVEMTNDETAQLAMKGINGRTHKGRTLETSLARERVTTGKRKFE